MVYPKLHRFLYYKLSITLPKDTRVNSRLTAELFSIQARVLLNLKVSLKIGQSIIWPCHRRV